jgi:hypothetical protein
VTLYDTLGVPVGAAPEVVRDAYKELARRYHPDANARSTSDDRERTERRMRDLNEAWAVLRDPERREDYDRRIGVSGGRSFVRPPEPATFTPVDADDEDDIDDVIDLGWYEEDEGDPRSAPGRAALAVPIALTGAAVVAFASWVLLAEEVVFVAAVVLAALAFVAFFALPVVVMAKAARVERDRPGGPSSADRR